MVLYQGGIWVSPGWRAPTARAGKMLASLVQGLPFLGCNLGKKKKKKKHLKQIIAENKNARNVLNSKWRTLTGFGTFSV